MNRLEMYVVYNGNRPLAFAKGDNVETLMKKVGEQFPGYHDLRFVTAVEAPLADVQVLTNVLLAEWLLAQFSMLAQMGRRVVPAGGAGGIQ